MDDQLRAFANRKMQALNGNKRTYFSKELIEEAYPSDEPYGSLAMLEADAALHGVKIVPFSHSGTELYMALKP
jgi:hypothetical protein